MIEKYVIPFSKETRDGEGEGNKTETQVLVSASRVWDDDDQFKERCLWGPKLEWDMRGARWCAGNRLTTGSPAAKALWCIVLASVCGPTPVIADCKLPIWRHWTQSWEERAGGTAGSWGQPGDPTGRWQGWTLENQRKNKAGRTLKNLGLSPFYKDKTETSTWT